MPPQLSVQMLIKSHQVSRPGRAMVHLGSPWSVAPCVRQLSLCEALTFLPGNGQGVRAPTRRVPGDPAAAEGLRTCPTAAHDSHSHECRDRDASGALDSHCLGSAGWCAPAGHMGTTWKELPGIAAACEAWHGECQAAKHWVSDHQARLGTVTNCHGVEGGFAPALRLPGSSPGWSVVWVGAGCMPRPVPQQAPRPLSPKEGRWCGEAAPGLDTLVNSKTVRTLAVHSCGSLGR